MRELVKPAEIDGDENATEMIRVWLAHNDLNVSLLLGMWEDADDCDIDESEAWGKLLADTVQHIANGLKQSHDWDIDTTVAKISRSFLKNVNCPEGEITGGYTE